MLVEGRGAGAGNCLWANEFEIGAICRALGLACLILDLQAGTREGRYVGVNVEEGVEIFVILQRSRREHYNLVTVAGRGLFGGEDLPEMARKLWKIGEG